MKRDSEEVTKIPKDQQNIPRHTMNIDIYSYNNENERIWENEWEDDFPLSRNTYTPSSPSHSVQLEQSAEVVDFASVDAYLAFSGLLD